jgi:hypothetical protein
MSVDHRDHSVAALLVDPGAVVGQFVRRRDERSHRYTAWAQVVMTAPSVSGPCWLVAFIDGDVDVWRIDDPTAHYQFRAPAMPRDVSS